MRTLVFICMFLAVAVFVDGQTLNLKTGQVRPLTAAEKADATRRDAEIKAAATAVADAKAARNAAIARLKDKARDDADIADLLLVMGVK